jgi:ATP-dependent RNA helicase RhlE
MMPFDSNRNKPISQPVTPVCQPAVPPIRPGQGFYGLGIAPKILDVLERIKFKTPTPIQAKVIPQAIKGADIVGIAQTGTGKTHAFAIPMVQSLAQNITSAGLVLAPTRELAIQIYEAFRPVAQAFGIKTTFLVGGVSINDQTRTLRGNPRIIIATPGRLMDHMERRNVRLDNVTMLVLDEADRMLDMGFAPQVEKILSFISKKRQTMLFSATMAREIMDVTNRHMKLPLSIEIAPSGTTAELVTQELFIVKPEAKLKLLNKLLGRYPGSVLLFVRMKHQAGKIAKSIRMMGYSASEIHSNRTQAQRKEALDGFKSGRHKVLVATDVAARGIDVSGIELVINFDLPDDTEYYVHRIGRTGRAGHAEHAISFATPDQSRIVADIEKLIRTTLPISRHPEITQEQFTRTVVWAARRPGRFRGRRR